MTRKLSRRLVLLSGSAVAAVYMAGYVATRGAVADAGEASGQAAPLITPTSMTRGAAASVATDPRPGLPTPTAPRSNPQSRRDDDDDMRDDDHRDGAFDRRREFDRRSDPRGRPTVPAASSVQVAPSATSTTNPSPTAASIGYRDGAYSGTGTSRRGGFDVAVTIRGGRITNVALTRAFTQYPASRIGSSAEQVVQRQSARVDRITGATYSVQAFQTAVQQALDIARA